MAWYRSKVTLFLAGGLVTLLCFYVVTAYVVDYLKLEFSPDSFGVGWAAIAFATVGGTVIASFLESRKKQHL
jgi:hypothetical protein